MQLEDVKTLKSNYITIGKEVDDAYISEIKESMEIKIPDDFKAVYIPIHKDAVVAMHICEMTAYF